MSFPETAKTPRPYFPLLNLDLLSRVRTVSRQPMIFRPLQAPLFTPHPDSVEIHGIKTNLERNQARQADQIKARWKTQFPKSYEYIYGRHAPPPD